MRLPPAARTHAETQIQTQHRADRPRHLDRTARTCNSASPALLCVRPAPAPAPHTASPRPRPPLPLPPSSLSARQTGLHMVRGHGPRYPLPRVWQAPAPTQAPAPVPDVISIHTPGRLAHGVRARAHTPASPVPRTARPRSRCPPPSPSAHPRLQWWTPPCRNTVADLAPSQHTSLRTRGCAVPAWDPAPRYRPARGVRARTLASLAPRTARPRPAPTAAAISVHVRAAAPVYTRAPDAVPAWDPAPCFKPARGVWARTPASPAPPPLPQPSPSACARQRRCTPPRRMLVLTSRPRGTPLCARGEVPGLYPVRAVEAHERVAGAETGSGQHRERRQGRGVCGGGRVHGDKQERRRRRLHQRAARDLVPCKGAEKLAVFELGVWIGARNVATIAVRSERRPHGFIDVFWEIQAHFGFPKPCARVLSKIFGECSFRGIRGIKVAEKRRGKSQGPSNRAGRVFAGPRAWRRARARSGGVEGQKVTDVTSGHTAETSDARSDKRLSQKVGNSVDDGKECHISLVWKGMKGKKLAQNIAQVQDRVELALGFGLVQ
ncbi:hypothetical protein B0H14DRAFT_3140436 [Mycena olivaceomarginata]|nr:hypothetical protein B0H14DRAFT_3140436 [Mycena olivaceomarginata]